MSIDLYSNCRAFGDVGVESFVIPTESHHCHCNTVTQCKIFTHPSSRVQEALNCLMDAIAEFDDDTNSSSVLFLKTTHLTGVFTSITRKRHKPELEPRSLQKVTSTELRTLLGPGSGSPMNGGF